MVLISDFWFSIAFNEQLQSSERSKDYKYLASYWDSLDFHDFHSPYSYVVVVRDHLVVASFAVQGELQSLRKRLDQICLIITFVIAFLNLPLPIGLLRLFRLFIGGHIWPLFFITCGFWLIGLPMLFIAWGLFPKRAPGLGAIFGEFIPRCGLELPIQQNYHEHKLIKWCQMVGYSFGDSNLPGTRPPLCPILGELTDKFGLELPIREPFGEFMLFRCEFGVLFIWANCPSGVMEDILEFGFAFMAFIPPAPIPPGFIPLPGIIMPRLLCIGPSIWLLNPKVLFLNIFCFSFLINIRVLLFKMNWLTFDVCFAVQTIHSFACFHVVALGHYAYALVDVNHFLRDEQVAKSFIVSWSAR